jgi:hypothetical protein
MIVNRPVIIQSNVDFAKKSDVQGSTTIPSAVNFLRTMGFSEQGDGGGALYTGQGSEPAHEGKIQDANSRWWEISPNGQGYLKVLSFAGDDLGAKFNAAVAAVKDLRESATATWHRNINGILIPPGLYDLEEAMEIDLCSNVSVYAYGAQIRNLTGAFHALKVVESSNVIVNGLRLDFRNNNVAPEAVMVAGSCNWLTFNYLAVQGNSSDATFAAVRMKQGDSATGFDDNDRNQGNFWTTFNNFWCRKNSASDLNEIGIAIDAQGCQNALRVVNGSINNFGTGVLVQNQNASTSSGISNDVQILHTSFEDGSGTAVKFYSTDSDGVAGGAIAFCRFEDCDAVSEIDGVGTPVGPITMIGNTVISSVTNYIIGTTTNSYNVYDNIRTPELVTPRIFSPNGVYIGMVSGGTTGSLRVTPYTAASGGAIALEIGNTSTARPTRISTLIGLSGTTTHASNLRGDVTVSGAATTATETFSTNETDGTFEVVLTAKSSTGAPAAGSNRILSYTTATTGFTITVEAAPGIGSTVTFSWILIR